jgi:Acetyltransferase (GNAT) family.
MKSQFAIEYRQTQFSEASLLPAIEQSAARAFLSYPDFARLAQESGLSEEEHRLFITQNSSWVALHSQQPIGFILAEPLEDSLFIVELSVALEWQNFGVGRSLLKQAAREAKRRSLSALTLTTFRAIPWNAPFYQRQGFELLDDSQLSPGLRQKLENEAAHGLRRETRCAMRREVSSVLPDALRLSGLPPDSIVE